MPWLGAITVVGLAALAFLTWLYLKLHSQDLVSQLIEKRRATSQLVSRAEYVEGPQRIPVVLALANDVIFYENTDLQASLELSRIEEVEYDEETATGRSVTTGKALRLRSHGHSFEFLLDPATAQQWEALLPERRMSQSPTAQAV